MECKLNHHQLYLSFRVILHYHILPHRMICNYYNSGSWASHVKDQHQWIQVEFKRHFKIGAIQTQGRSDAGQWVKTYKLSYGNDGINWWGIYDKNGKERVKLLFKYT